MKAATLIRRMNAEGFDLEEISKSILVEGKKMKTGGGYGRDESHDVSIHTMAVMMAAQVKYVDGFLPGGYTELDGARHPTRIHWTLKGGYEENDLATYIASAEEALKKSSRVIKVSADALNWDIWEREGDTFRHMSGQCEAIRFSERNTLFLPEGIRAAVAKALGYNLESTTFHAAFDAAVAKLYCGVDWCLD